MSAPTGVADGEGDREPSTVALGVASLALGMSLASEPVPAPAVRGPLGAGPVATRQRPRP